MTIYQEDDEPDPVVEIIGSILAVTGIGLAACGVIWRMVRCLRR